MGLKKAEDNANDQYTDEVSAYCDYLYYSYGGVLRSPAKYAKRQSVTEQARDSTPVYVWWWQFSLIHADSKD